MESDPGDDPGSPGRRPDRSSIGQQILRGVLEESPGHDVYFRRVHHDLAVLLGTHRGLVLSCSLTGPLICYLINRKSDEKWKSNEK